MLIAAITTVWVLMPSFWLSASPPPPRLPAPAAVGSGSAGAAIAGNADVDEAAPVDAGVVDACVAGWLDPEGGSIVALADANRVEAGVDAAPVEAAVLDTIVVCGVGGWVGRPVGGAVSPTSEMSHDSSLAARQHMTPSLCRTSSPPPQLSHRNTRGLPRPPDRALEQKSTLDPLNITEPSSVPQVTVRSERSPAKLSVAMAEMTLPSAFLQDGKASFIVDHRCHAKDGAGGPRLEIGT